MLRREGRREEGKNIREARALASADAPWTPAGWSDAAWLQKDSSKPSLQEKAAAAQKRAEDVAKNMQRFTDKLFQKYDDVTIAFQAIDFLNRNCGNLTMVELEDAAIDLGFQGDLRSIYHALNKKRDGRLDLGEFVQIESVTQALAEKADTLNSLRGRATSRERRNLARPVSSPGDGRARAKGGTRTHPLKLTSSNLDALQLDLDSSGDIYALTNSTTRLRSQSPQKDADASAFFCERWEEWTSSCSEAIVRGDDLPEPPQVPRTKDTALRLVARTTWAARKLVGELASRGGETRQLQKTVADVQSDLSKSKADARKLCDRVSELMRVHSESLQASHAEVAELQQKVQDLMAAPPQERVQAKTTEVVIPETVFNEHGRSVPVCDKCAKSKKQLQATQLAVQKLQHERAKLQRTQEEYSREMASIQIRSQHDHEDVLKAMKKSESQRAMTVDGLKQIIDRFSHKIGADVLKESVDSSRGRVPSFGHTSPRDTSPSSRR